MFISFAWTTKPFLADSKKVTRRYWKDSHVKKFTKGQFVEIYDKLPYRGGKIIGKIMLTTEPYQQRTGLMTEDDYWKEGLHWMEISGISINGKRPRQFFEDWKEKNDLVWVVEFEKIS